MAFVTCAPSPDEPTPDWASSALLVIDFQRDLADDGDHPIPGTSGVAPAVRGLAAAFRGAGRPIVHVVRLYPTGGDADLPRRAAIRSGTARLHDWLTERGVTSLAVAGCNLPNCPRATLFDASNHDYRAAPAVDAVCQVTQARLDDLSLIGIQLVTTAQVRSALERVTSTAPAPSE